jgi:type I restriction enzyme M protein
VAQTAEKVRDEAELLALLWKDNWKDEEGRLKALLDTITAQADLPLLPDMSDTRIAAHNREQQALVTAYSGFIKVAQSSVVMLDRHLRDYEKAIVAKAEADNKRRPQDKKLRDAKTAWEAYSASIKAADEPFVHARWLHDRFPDACYVDVIGLCKLATKAEVAAQDYSLNAGRYVGIVIDEDGKTADEFRADLLALNTELKTLNAEAASLATTISHNIQQLSRAAQLIRSFGERR